jgi:drug/metabolite transporter (DMT)-like permease
MPLTAIILIITSTFIHAGWNMVVRAQQNSYLFLRITLVISLVGLGPALLAEFWGTPFPASVWLYLLLAGVFQAGYYLGLTQGYRHGDFTVVYPIARALPILLVALADVARGDIPVLLAWLGMIAVSAGCVVVPLQSLREFRLKSYQNQAMAWTLLTAGSIVGYTVVDKAAVELLPTSPWTAARYGVFETAFSAIGYWLVLKYLRQPTGGIGGWEGWKWPIVGAVGVYSAYWLVLWAYQLSSHASYVVALRQLSIVIGVALGATFFREPARVLRFSTSLVIALGVVCIALVG